MLRKLSLTVTLLAILGGIAGQTAQAHFLYHHKKISLEKRISYFKRSIDHDKHAINWYASAKLTARRNLRTLSDYSDLAAAYEQGIRWHKAALRWHKELLARYQKRWDALHPPLPPHYSEWLCIHSHEGSWTDDGAPYWGGVQFGSSEWHRFGTPYTGVDTANLASPLEQMWAAERYWRVSGFYPWPRTARMCGLI